jgi:foldase protein PrsA
MRIDRKFRALGALFVAAFAAAVIAGCGSGVPSNSVASVAGNPITTQAFDHWMFVNEKGNAAQSPGAAVIVPTDPPRFRGCIRQVRAQLPAFAKTPDATIVRDCKQLFTALSAHVMDFLIRAYWYQADAARAGIHVTQRQIDAVIAKQRKQFPSLAQYEAYVKSLGMTTQDVNWQARVDTIFQKLLARATRKITPAAISAYYASHKSTFGTPPSRDIRIVRASSQSAAQAALTALKSGQSWSVVAKKYSVDLASKNNGGLIRDVTNGEEEEAVNRIVFEAPLNKLEGPVHGTFGWYVVEVVKINPGTQQSLTQATPLIKELLLNQYQTAAEQKVASTGQKNWRGQTHCQPLYVMADCSEYKAPKGGTATIGAGGAAGGAAGSSGAASGGAAGSSG